MNTNVLKALKNVRKCAIRLTLLRCHVQNLALCIRKSEERRAKSGGEIAARGQNLRLRVMGLFADRLMELQEALETAPRLTRMVRRRLAALRCEPVSYGGVSKPDVVSLAYALADSIDDILPFEIGNSSSLARQPNEERGIAETGHQFGQQAILNLALEVAAFPVVSDSDKHWIVAAIQNAVEHLLKEVEATRANPVTKVRLVLQTNLETVRVDGQVFSLNERQFEVASVLANNPGKWMCAKEILRPGGSQGKLSFSAPRVGRSIKSMPKKLRQLIATQRGCNGGFSLTLFAEEVEIRST